MGIDQGHEQNNQNNQLVKRCNKNFVYPEALMKWMIGEPEVSTLLEVFHITEENGKKIEYGHFEDSGSHERLCRSDVLSFK